MILPHFASSGGNESNFYYAIYNMLIQLREQLDISQKVELLEEKIRKFFLYWLDVCSRTLQYDILLH